MGNLDKFRENGAVIANAYSCCRFCGLSFFGMKATKASSHVPWCKENPKRQTTLAKLAETRGKINKDGRGKGAAAVINNDKCCKYCGKIFNGLRVTEAANHARWCKKNPKLYEYSEAIHKTSQMHTIAVLEKKVIALRVARKKDVNGKYAAAPAKALETKKRNGTLRPTEETKEKMRQSARAATHQRVCKSTHDFVDKKGRTFRFDSTWEDALAVRLDELDIEWDRPKPIAYVQDGKTKNYFADFYLPAYDLYLDPKNSYCLTQQKPKLDIVKGMVKLAILPSLKDCKEFHPDHCEAYMLF